MDFAKVSVEVRNNVGKGAARRARAAGKVPGVLYGPQKAPVAVSFDARALVKSLDKEKRRNTVFALTLTAGDQAEEVTAMIREAQIDPISQTLMHVDFLRVSLEQEVHVTVPLHLVGKPIGVIDGGQLHQSMHVLRVATKPAAIPAHIDVDVSGLHIGEAVHVSDLKLGAGVRALVEARDSVASVVAPKAEKVEAEAAPTEGAVPAEGAAAAAGAAGDKAAAPAAGGDKGAAKGGAAAKGGGDKKEEKKK